MFEEAAKKKDFTNYKTIKFNLQHFFTLKILHDNTLEFFLTVETESKICYIRIGMVA